MYTLIPYVCFPPLNYITSYQCYRSTQICTTPWWLLPRLLKGHLGGRRLLTGQWQAVDTMSCSSRLHYWPNCEKSCKDCRYKLKIQTSSFSYNNIWSHIYTLHVTYCHIDTCIYICVYNIRIVYCFEWSLHAYTVHNRFTCTMLLHQLYYVTCRLKTVWVPLLCLLVSVYACMQVWEWYGGKERKGGGETERERQLGRKVFHLQV